MLNWKIRRTALLAGLSLAVLAGATSSQASSVRWGATAPPYERAIHEPVQKPRKERAVNRKPAERETGRTVPRRIETTGSGSTRYFTFPAYQPPQKPSRKHDRKPATDRKAKSPEKAEHAGPVVPDGPLHVVVSIASQTAALYANGRFVASTKVSTGTKSHPTPLGVFTVIQKNRHHISNLYGAPMPYMQRLTWSGTALHAGPLPGYPASHGCVRLTEEFAQLLWKTTRLGARVIVTRDEVKPQDVAHAQLAMTVRSPAPVAEATETIESAQATDAGAPVRTADAAAGTTGSTANLAIPAPAPIISGADLQTKPAAKNARPAPISMFISRKDKKLYVRQAMKPLFSMPLNIGEPDQPVGTHVYTAMEMKDGAMRWTAITVPSGFPREAVRIIRSGKGKSAKTVTVTPPAEAPAPEAAAALDRINLPQEALDRIAGLVIPGSSLIVSDNGLSSETGSYTDFIVLTR
jgi:lipoprotein-anchoring transpeptidase ErfK/SrfK